MAQNNSFFGLSGHFLGCQDEEEEDVTMETNEHVKIVLLWTLWEWVSQREDKNASVKRTQGSTD